MEPAEPVDLSPDPLRAGVVAAVDGEPILEAELERLTTSMRSEAEPETSPDSDSDSEAEPGAARVERRRAALQQLVERRLVQAGADRLGILVSDDEIQRAVEQIATTNGLTMEQLQAAVAEQGMSWDDYRDEVLAQIIEMRVLSFNGVFDTTSGGTETFDERRARLLGCMRARSQVQVQDPALALPDNPFAVLTEIGRLRFDGTLGLPESELRTAAEEAAKTRMRLCDALTSAELALQELYMEHGFLEARVRIPWPEATTPPVDLEVRVEAGRPHTLGTIAFDQRVLPRAKRLSEDDLRGRVGLFLTPGEPAKMSVMQAASQEIRDAFLRSGLGMVESEVERSEGKDQVRVNITYRAVGKS